jgi:hypothetical protein
MKHPLALAEKVRFNQDEAFVSTDELLVVAILILKRDHSTLLSVSMTDSGFRKLRARAHHEGQTRSEACPTTL